MIESRSKKSARNIAFVALSRILRILLTFVVRTLLIKYLGVEILGLDGLFSSVISVLSIADLGLGSAVVYSLYKPISDKNEKMIAAYISFFGRIYSIIGCVVIVFGIVTIPFLKHLVNLNETIDNVELLYLLTIIATASSYFFSSRRIIFEADQCLYKIATIDFLFNIGLQIVQIVVILLFKEYALVLVIRALFALLNNFVIYARGNAFYNYLTEYKWERLEKRNIVNLWKNTGAILCHKIGGVLVSGVDNMIISVFVGTLFCGYYSNYLLVISSIASFITLGLNALIPSVGNLRATTDNIEYHNRVFKEVLLINYILSAFSCIMLFLELDNFIAAWVGADYLLEKKVVLLLCVNYYISTMRFGCGAFNTAAGYFKQTLIKPIAEGIINLIFSIFLVQQIGILGVFVGTLASLTLGSTWVDPFVLYKYWFKKSSIEYFGIYFKMLLITIIVGVIMYFSSRIYIPHNFPELLLHTTICSLVCMALVLSSTFFLPGRRNVYDRIKKMIVRK